MVSSSSSNCHFFPFTFFIYLLAILSLHFILVTSVTRHLFHYLPFLFVLIWLSSFTFSFWFYLHLSSHLTLPIYYLQSICHLFYHTVLPFTFLKLSSFTLPSVSLSSSHLLHCAKPYCPLLSCPPTREIFSIQFQSSSPKTHPHTPLQTNKRFRSNLVFSPFACWKSSLPFLLVLPIFYFLLKDSFRNLPFSFEWWKVHCLLWLGLLSFTSFWGSSFYNLLKSLGTFTTVFVVPISSALQLPLSASCFMFLCTKSSKLQHLWWGWDSWKTTEEVEILWNELSFYDLILLLSINFVMDR